jgi:pilus assembly protein FimV
MHRRFNVLMGAALVCNSLAAAAAQLGPMDIRSAVCQPLLLDIPITQATPAELQHVAAQLVSPGAAGAALRVSLADARNQAGQKSLRITSATPVTQPLLELRVTFQNGASGGDVHDFHIALPSLSMPALTQTAADGTDSAVAQACSAQAGMPLLAQQAATAVSTAPVALPATAPVASASVAAATVAPAANPVVSQPTLGSDILVSAQDAAEHGGAAGKGALTVTTYGTGLTWKSWALTVY